MMRGRESLAVHGAQEEVGAAFVGAQQWALLHLEYQLGQFKAAVADPKASVPADTVRPPR
jgi:hypothetical protein